MKNPNLDRTRPYRDRHGRSKRAVADGAKGLIEQAWAALGLYGASDRLANAHDLRELVAQLTALYGSLESTPHRRRILVDARRVVTAMRDALREADAEGATAGAVALGIDLPPPGSVAEPTAFAWPEQASSALPAEGREIPAPRTEYGWMLLLMRREGGKAAVESFHAIRAEAQKRYRKTPTAKKAAKRYAQSEKGKAAAKLAVQRYAQSEKGKAARKAAQARYRAKMKQSVNNT